ncbi:MAG: hypothetical protein FJZ01_21030 [Candidatus Sericytochromatia bacterium]|nr:hypothetical protein [Candidatus Tanganyikabacteria bacterium]
MRLSRLILPVLFAGLSAGGPARAAEPGAFTFMAIGDVPYYIPDDYPGFERLIAAINRARPAFTVHVGDFKKGAKPCDDATFDRAKAYFDSFEAPLVYTPGDNEWTDCHGSGFDPLERLARLRTLFFARQESLGRAKLTVARQSDRFPENARWQIGPVLFATIHTVGSNNNLLRDDPAAFQEYLGRTKANLAWLEEAFRVAKGQKARGVVVMTQANPGFDKWFDARSGFNSFVDALTKEARAFPGQTLLIHGDTHQFRIDKPLKRGTDPNYSLMRFTRAEVFAEKDLHALRVTVDTAAPDLFLFSTLSVSENLDAEGFSK